MQNAGKTSTTVSQCLSYNYRLYHPIFLFRPVCANYYWFQKVLDYTWYASFFYDQGKFYGVTGTLFRTSDDSAVCGVSKPGWIHSHMCSSLVHKDPKSHLWLQEPGIEPRSLTCEAGMIPLHQPGWAYLEFFLCVLHIPGVSSWGSISDSMPSITQCASYWL